MRPCLCTSLGTLYKGLFLLVIVLLILEYLFGSISDNKQVSLFNTTRNPHSDLHHSPLLTNLHQLIVNASKPQTNLINPSEPQPTSLNSSNSIHKLFELSTEKGMTKNSTADFQLQPCPTVVTNLRGRIQVKKAPVPTVGELEARFGWLRAGGHSSPERCRPATSVAIVVPFRCRGEHLLLFLQHMHPFLRRQQLDYTLFVVEQAGGGPFNRAMLMNVGFVEALKLRRFDCFIFHDIDLLPEDDRNVYSCPGDQPRHMSVAIDIFKYELPYVAIFGGVSAIKTEQFRLLNGFSNAFWGWGGEDDDMSNRIRYHNLFISRYPLTIARYTMLTHKKDKPSPQRFDVLKKGVLRYDKDGLSNLQYEIVKSKKNLLYSWLLVGIEPPS